MKYNSISIIKKYYYLCWHHHFWCWDVFLHLIFPSSLVVRISWIFSRCVRAFWPVLKSEIFSFSVRNGKRNLRIDFDSFDVIFFLSHAINFTYEAMASCFVVSSHYFFVSACSILIFISSSNINWHAFVTILWFATWRPSVNNHPDLLTAFSLTIFSLILPQIQWLPLAVSFWLLNQVILFWSEATLCLRLIFLILNYLIIFSSKEMNCKN